MKGIVLLFLTYVTFHDLTAQEISPVENSRSHWTVGVTGSVDYCDYITVLNGEFGPQVVYYWENPSIGWTAGVNACRILNENWSLSGGLRFSEHNLDIGPYSVYDANRSNIGTIKLIYHNRFLDLPIGIQFNTSTSRRISFLSNFCLAPGYAIGQWIELDFEGNADAGIQDSQHRSTSDNFNLLSLKTELYAGVGINFGPFQAQVLPQGRINLLRAKSTAIVNRQYWSTGLEFRVLYTL